VATSPPAFRPVPPDPRFPLAFKATGDDLAALTVGAPDITLTPTLGPLAALPGSWTGNGFNVITLPKEPPAFRVMLDTTQELLEFSTIGSPIPNRGPAIEIPDPTPFDGLESGDIEFVGLHYLQRISDAETHGALHIEPGIWLNVPRTQLPVAGPTVVRLATVPHGDSLMAQGPACEPQAGGPKIPATNTIPFVTATGKPVSGRYLEVLTGAQRPPGITMEDIIDPNLLLKRTIKGQTILDTTVLSVCTEPDGGITNIPFIVANADAVSMEATFWIETVLHPQSTAERPLSFLQLQYSQSVILRFDDIDWPHVTVATLVKTW
jgi:hypothetical protein